MSTIRAGALLEYFLKEIAPLAYNQSVEDARAQVVRLAEDLPGNCFEESLQYWEKDSPSRGVRRRPER